MDYKTKHYIFHCVNNKTAERDIEAIAKRQEQAYADITQTLNVKYESLINYYLVNTPEEVAEMAGYQYPVNGLACILTKSVYAVYTDEIKCIGPHEDAHLISEEFGISYSDFLSEGLAMHFDKCWWNVKNEFLCKFFIDENNFIDPIKLLNNQEFYNYDCSITYPIAGAFTSYLIKNSGIENYKKIYTLENVNKINTQSAIYKELRLITNKFIDEIKNTVIHDAEKESIKNVYNANAS